VSTRSACGRRGARTFSKLFRWSNKIIPRGVQLRASGIAVTRSDCRDFDSCASNPSGRQCALCSSVTARAQALQILTTLGLSIAASSCGSSASTSLSPVAPVTARCQATVVSSSGSYGATGGSGTVTVTVPRECAWSAVSQNAWVTITSGGEGQGDGSVTYRVAENTDPVSRQANLIVSERQVTVAQGAAPCRFDVGSSASGPLAPEGGELIINLRTHPACGWNAASEVAFASAAPGEGRGDAAVRVSVQPNAGPERVISVLVAGQRITSTQRQAAAAPPAPSPAPPPNPPAPTPGPGPTPPAPAPPPPPPVPGPPSPAPPSEPAPVRPIDVSGRIGRDISGSCPAVVFAVGDRLVYTSVKTDYDEGKCKDIRRGEFVEVRGMLMSDGRVRADRVNFDRDDN
jgi:hypothetical protein